MFAKSIIFIPPVLFSPIIDKGSFISLMGIFFQDGDLKMPFPLEICVFPLKSE